MWKGSRPRLRSKSTLRRASASPIGSPRSLRQPSNAGPKSVAAHGSGAPSAPVTSARCVAKASASVLLAKLRLSAVLSKGIPAPDGARRQWRVLPKRISPPAMTSIDASAARWFQACFRGPLPVR